LGGASAKGASRGAEVAEVGCAVLCRDVLPPQKIF